MATPDTGHLARPEFAEVYPPAEDSFLLMDALLADRDAIAARRPLICWEIGTGSGAVLAFLGTILSAQRPYMIATDVNAAALAATRQTCAAAQVRLGDAVLADLAGPLAARLAGQVDVLVFNPPYVVTPSEEVGARDLSAAWAGGIDGREVTDRLLPHVDRLLSSDGALYLVALDANKPHDLIRWFHDHTTLAAQVVLSRRAGMESLHILRVRRSGAP